MQRPLLTAEAQQPAEEAAPSGRKDRVALGMLWYAASSFFFAGMGICSKLLGHEGYVVWEITLFRAVIIMTFSLSVLFSQGAPLSRGIHVVLIALFSCVPMLSVRGNCWPA